MRVYFPAMFLLLTVSLCAEEPTAPPGVPMKVPNRVGLNIAASTVVTDLLGGEDAAFDSKVAALAKNGKPISLLILTHLMFELPWDPAWNLDEQRNSRKAKVEKTLDLLIKGSEHEKLSAAYFRALKGKEEVSAAKTALIDWVEWYQKEFAWNEADKSFSLPENIEPPGLKFYKKREVAQTMHFAGAEWLVREAREREEECSTLLRILNIKTGQAVCDMGSGNGFYTIPIARLVGETGRVLAVEIQPEMLELLAKRAASVNIKNIEPIVGTLTDPKLPEGKLDMVLLVDVYHEFSHPVHMLAAIRKSLKPDGRMVLVEFRAEDPKVPIKPLHKMSKDQINQEVPPNGFKLVEQFDGLPWQHVMFFQRDDSVKVDPPATPPQK